MFIVYFLGMSFFARVPMIMFTEGQFELSAALTHLQRLTVINIVNGMPRHEAYTAAGGKAAAPR